MYTFRGAINALNDNVDDIGRCLASRHRRFVIVLLSADNDNCRYADKGNEITRVTNRCIKNNGGIINYLILMEKGKN